MNIRFLAIYFLQFSFYVILTSYTKFELNSLRNNEITVTLPSTVIFGCRDKAKVRNDAICKQWLCIPQGVIIPSFMIVGSQMPELDLGGAFLPPI